LPGEPGFFLTAPEHDRVCALVSHLPHVIANVYASQVYEKDYSFSQFAGSSFRDLTRIAGSSPEVWLDIFLTNQTQILSVIDEMVELNITIHRRFLHAKGGKKVDSAKIQHYKRVLLNLQSRINQLLTIEQNYLREFNPLTESRDEGDFSQATVDREMGLLSRDALLQISKLIESSLKKIEDGSYGICERCHQEIPEGRLKALPYTPYCVSCQSIIEKKYEK
jgi:RNA polymerase-binding protein DksA